VALATVNQLVRKSPKSTQMFEIVTGPVYVQRCSCVPSGTVAIDLSVFLPIAMHGYLINCSSIRPNKLWAPCDSSPQLCMGIWLTEVQSERKNLWVISAHSYTQATMWYTSSWDRILCAGLQPTNFHSSLRTNNEDKGNMPHEIMVLLKRIYVVTFQ